MKKTKITSIICQNDNQLENTQVILDVREYIEAMYGNYGSETYLTPSSLLLNHKTKAQVQ